MTLHGRDRCAGSEGKTKVSKAILRALAFAVVGAFALSTTAQGAIITSTPASANGAAFAHNVFHEAIDANGNGTPLVALDLGPGGGVWDDTSTGNIEISLSIFDLGACCTTPIGTATGMGNLDPAQFNGNTGNVIGLGAAVPQVPVPLPMLLFASGIVVVLAVGRRHRQPQLG